MSVPDALLVGHMGSELKHKSDKIMKPTTVSTGVAILNRVINN